MSDVENVKEEGMFVHQVEWDVIEQLISNANNVNKLFTYTMPKKAESYAKDGFKLLEEINKYGEDEEESWRIGLETNVQMSYEDGKLKVGDWEINKSLLNICIPAINSIIIIPDGESTYKGNKEYTKIVQLTNCIAVTPLLIKLIDVPNEDENKQKYSLGMRMEIITASETTENEEPTE